MNKYQEFRKEFLKKCNLLDPVLLKIKKKKLKDLIEKNAHLPDQGTDEWLKIRRFNIGGSEMATITKSGGYSNIKSLIASKVGLTKFTGRLATRWGKMFENITILLMEEILEVEGKIQETSSIEGAVKYQRYSPDGLAIIKIKCGDLIAGEYIEKYEYSTVLFEFKSPYSSIPNGKIAKYYLPQVMTGLCSIPITDFAIFVNNMYRKCKLEDFNITCNYDSNFHNKDKEKVKIEEPIALGFVFLYFDNKSKEKFLKSHKKKNSDSDSDSDSDSGSDSDSDSDSDSGSDSDSDLNIDNFMDSISHTPKKNTLIEDLYDIASGNSDKIIDFGRSNYYEFDDIMYLYDNSEISVHYCNPLVIQKNVHNIEFMKNHFNPKNQNIDSDIENYKIQIEKFSKKENMIGFIPYKLFKSDMIVKLRDPDYVKRYESEIYDVIKKVKEIIGDNFDDLNEIQKKFRKYFPYKSDSIDKKIDEFLLENSGYDDMIPLF